ncbi:hypothetical protein KUCAC02_014963, partial [Chaenocephalus aceratus]
MRILVNLLLDTLPMLGNVLLLCFFVFFIFGIIGVQLWAGLLRNRCYPAENFTLLNFTFEKYTGLLVLLLSAERADKHPRGINLPRPYYSADEDDERPFICSLPIDNGIMSCADVPARREGGRTCCLDKDDALYRQSLGLSPEPLANGSVSVGGLCVNWNQYYTRCHTGLSNPHKGAINFDNICFAWIVIFQVITLEGWVEIMYYVMDAHSFYNFIYFILLIIIGSFFMINLCLVVIATQFSETKQREHQLMQEQRARCSSNSTLDSEPGDCYEAVFQLVCHMIRKARRQTVFLFNTLRGKPRPPCPHHSKPDHTSATDGCPQCAAALSLTGPTRTAVKEETEEGAVEETDREGAHSDTKEKGNTGQEGAEKQECCSRKKGCKEIWHDITMKLWGIVESKYFNRGIMIAILINTISMGIEHHEQGRLKIARDRTRESLLPHRRGNSELKCLCFHRLFSELQSWRLCVNSGIRGLLSLLALTLLLQSAAPPVLLHLWSDAGVDTADYPPGCRGQTRRASQRISGKACTQFNNSPHVGTSQPEELTNVLEICNIVFTSMFSLEMLLKLTAFGSFSYLRNPYNVFDGIIVIISVCEIVGQSDGGLSVLRTFRLLRVLKLVRFMPALRRQLVVLMKTMDNVATFCMLLMLFIFIFSILGMHIFGCKFSLKTDTGDTVPDRKNFDSLLWAIVTVFQILTQEDWNAVLYNGMAATSPLAALYFVALMTFGNYVLFNLLVAILVEGFQAEGDANRSYSDDDHSSFDESEKHESIKLSDSRICTLTPNGHLELGALSGPRGSRRSNSSERRSFTMESRKSSVKSSLKSSVKSSEKSSLERRSLSLRHGRSPNYHNWGRPLHPQSAWSRRRFSARRDRRALSLELPDLRGHPPGLPPVQSAGPREEGGGPGRGGRSPGGLLQEVGWTIGIRFYPQVNARKDRTDLDEETDYSMCFRVQKMMEVYKPDWCESREAWSVYLFSPRT